VKVSESQLGKSEAIGKEVVKWPVDVYTVDEAAARLRCSYHSVWRGVARGKIKACTYISGRIEPHS